jgi:predicted ribosomally synthesized peptide with SipW-like signal peptide
VFPRVFLLVAALTLALALATGGTLAWLSGQDARENAVRVADLKGSVSVDGGYAVANESSQPAVVRVMLLPVVTKGAALLPDNVLEYTLTADWTDGGDGYVYYTKVMGAGDELGAADIFAPGKTPAIASEPAFSFSEADITVKVKAEFMAATMWVTEEARQFAYRFAWFGTDASPGAEPLKTVDAKLAAAVEASYEASYEAGGE